MSNKSIRNFRRLDKRDGILDSLTEKKNYLLVNCYECQQIHGVNSSFMVDSLMFCSYRCYLMFNNQRVSE